MSTHPSRLFRSLTVAALSATTCLGGVAFAKGKRSSPTLPAGTLAATAGTLAAADGTLAAADGTLAAADGTLAALGARITRLEAELARRPLDISSYGLPEVVELCGHKIRIDDPDVRERLERELYLILGDREQVVLWTKRARRVFPVIEREAAAQRTCDDVKYLAVIESGLRAGVTSHANAHGFWQFMAPTARDYDLSVTEAYDERADLERSTKAGVKYLADLNRSLGDWSLAMAAYNTGPGRLRTAMSTQGQSDYWRLDLIDEADRYVPRVIAAKLVMSAPEAYGFSLRVEDGWEPEPVETLTMSLAAGRSVSLLDAARQIGIDYRTLRRLNPTLGSSALPSGRSFELVVPRGRSTAAQALAGRDTAAQATAGRNTASQATADGGPDGRSRQSESARRGKDVPAKHLVVKSGDTLFEIATRHGVRVADLRKWNGMNNREALKAGQRLVVRR